MMYRPSRLVRFLIVPALLFFLTFSTQKKADAAVDPVGVTIAVSTTILAIVAISEALDKDKCPCHPPPKNPPPKE